MERECSHYLDGCMSLLAIETSCYEVSLCENFQRQSYSRTIPLSRGVEMLAVNVTLQSNILASVTHPFQQRPISSYFRSYASDVRASEKCTITV